MKKLADEVLGMLPTEEGTKSFKVGDEVEVQDVVSKGNTKVGTIKKIHASGDAADVDFGGGDKYGVTFKRMKLTKTSEAKMSDYYHVEPYAADSFYVEDAEGGDETGPFKTKKEAQVECDKRNKEYNK